MTPYLTLDNDAKLKHGSDYYTDIDYVTLPPLFKLLYHNNLHIQKAMSDTISTIQNTNYQNANYIQITILQTKRNYQHINMNILSCSGSQLRYSPSLGCLPL